MWIRDIFLKTRKIMIGLFSISSLQLVSCFSSHFIFYLPPLSKLSHKSSIFFAIRMEQTEIQIHSFSLRDLFLFLQWLLSQGLSLGWQHMDWIISSEASSILRLSCKCFHLIGFHFAYWFFRLLSVWLFYSCWISLIQFLHFINLVNEKNKDVSNRCAKVVFLDFY